MLDQRSATASVDDAKVEDCRLAFSPELGSSWFMQPSMKARLPKRQATVSLLQAVVANFGLLIVAQTAHAEVAGDPTFNGLVARANCYVRTVNVCQAASCAQVIKGCQGDLCGTLSLFMKTRQFSFSTEQEPLQITGIAAAEVGKALWVKFLLTTKQGTGVGRYTLLPNHMGGYTGSAVVYKAADDDPSGRSFTLVDYDCEQMPDEP